MQKENAIQARTYAFAIRIVCLAKDLFASKKEYVLAKQLLRSGTAIGALCREAQHAESAKDFLHKMSIAQKEAHETEYWICLLKDTGFITDSESENLLLELTTIRKILAAITITMKHKISAKNQ